MMVGIRDNIIVIVTFLFQFFIPTLSIAYELQYPCSVPIDLIWVYSRDLSKFGQVYLISASILAELEITGSLTFRKDYGHFAQNPVTERLVAKVLLDDQLP